MKALKNGKKISFTGNGRGHVNSLKFTWKGVVCPKIIFGLWRRKKRELENN